VLAALRSLEPLCTLPPAEGAFYCCLRVHARADPMQLAERLIREHKVAVIPGTAFGLTNGCHFRVAFGALEKATVAEGIGRLVAGLRAILG
jgi:aspartate/methionine/tyrosine aminotransferase